MKFSNASKNIHIFEFLFYIRGLELSVPAPSRQTKLTVLISLNTSVLYTEQWGSRNNTFLNPYFHCEKKAESDSVLPSAWEYRPRSHAHDTLISVSVEYLNIPRWWNISLFYYRVSPKESRLKIISGTGCPKKLLALARSHAHKLTLIA